MIPESDMYPIKTLRQQARILILLDGAEHAGLIPMGIIPFHGFEYLANVMAPVWDMPALNGKILKRKGGPFYPTLQRDLDRLVGLGMVQISNVTHVQDSPKKWRLEGKYRLNRSMAQPAIDYLHKLPDEERFSSFVSELAYAISALGEDELERAFVEDATYSDPETSDNNVVDFDEWRRRNPSVNAANYFDELMPGGTKATVGEKLHLYVRHLRRRVHAS
ncbi:hypothetical protein D1BOALGB6SA_3608 [Olavius sp. associated proteobacterium Delta 1]|nr:hypothetical protein D1BOALGB6SA_3608 [Olavius sp. associated proteobacterium Delta 1]